MSAPGMNLLSMASRLIGFQSVQYYAFTGRTETAIGTLVSSYAAPVNIKGSWQNVPRELIEKYGLEFNTDYGMFYCNSTYLKDVNRDTSGDQVVYNNQRYQCLQTPSDWFVQDGWVGILCAQIKNPASFSKEKK